MICAIDDYLSFWFCVGSLTILKGNVAPRICVVLQQCMEGYTDDFCCPVLFYWIWEEREIDYLKTTLARWIEWRKLICGITFISRKMLLFFFFPFTLGLELESQQSIVWKGLLEIIWSLFLLQDLDLIIQDITKLSLNFFFPARRFHHFFDQSFPKFSCSHWIFSPLYSSILSPAATCAHYLYFVKIHPDGKSTSAFSMCTFFFFFR